MNLKYLDYIKRFRLMDDDFMVQCFSNEPKSVEFVLSVLLERDDIKVESVVTQHEIKNLEMHSVKLDVDAIDSNGKRYDIEIQRSDRGAISQRARFNSAMLDSTMLKSGAEYNELRDSYVIFITENDVLKKGKAIYHIERVIRETDEYFNDGSHILYVNGSYKGEDPIGRLMHDFRCCDPNEMYSPVLKARAEYFKSTEGGIQTMCRMMEEMRNEATAKAHADMAVNMFADGKLSKEDAIKYSGLDKNAFEELLEKKSN